MDKHQDDVPKLRFPEFTDEWHEKRFEELFVYKRTNSLSRSQLRTSGQVGNIHYGDIHMTLPTLLDLSAIHLPKVALEYAQSAGDIVRLGDVVMADASEDYTDIGKAIEIIKEDESNPVVAGLHTFLMRPKERSAIGFYGFALKTDKIRGQVMRIATGVSVLGLSKNNVSNVSLVMPSRPEQQKIASFLTAVDARITKQQQKLSLLKDYKKGVMQKIFTQQIRFKDENGKQFPDWERKMLGDIGVTYTGLTGKSGDDFGTGSNFITYMQIFNDSQIDTRKFAKVRISRYERQNKVKQGDIFFTTSSETPQEVGFTSVLLDKVEDTYLNSFCFGYRVNKKLLSPEFARFFFHSKEIRAHISRLAQGSTRFNLSKNELVKLSIKLPVIEEQQKIATFLAAFDDEIKAEQARLTAARQWKKGLLQGMFV